MPLAEKVKELSEKVEKTSVDKSLDSAPLERAMMRMTERLDRIETGRPSAAPASERGSRRQQKGFFARLFSD